MTDLCSKLCTVVGEIDCDPKRKAKSVLKPGHTIKGNLLTDDVDVRSISSLQTQTARSHVSLMLAVAALPCQQAHSRAAQRRKTAIGLVPSCMHSQTSQNKQRKPTALHGRSTIQQLEADTQSRTKGDSGRRI